MRLGYTESVTRHSLCDGLPAVYMQDQSTSEFVSAFDDVLMPVFLALDNLDAYVDPGLTPEDFLPWLAGWVGVTLDEKWPVARRRDLIARAAELYRWRGTKRGIAEAVEVYTGVRPDVTDNGGTVWSEVPDGDPPGRPRPSVTVTVTVPDERVIDEDRVDRIVADAKPVHVPHVVEIRRA